MPTSPPTSDPPRWWDWSGWSTIVAVAVVGALVAGVALRFFTRSPMWLDEALSVNIAQLPLGDIPDALRRDGHPPLYYVLLHGWMDLFGTSNAAVRAFSGVWAVALLPLTWIAGKRLGGPRVGWYGLGVVALLPFALRYGTEARMYAMVMVLVLAGWLVLDDALERPKPSRLVGVALLSGLLLWTHYWGIWLLAVTGLGLILQAVHRRRRDDREGFVATRNAIGALIVGGLLFVPWLPNLLYQGAHTGTPWARPVRPTEMLTYTLADLGGGPLAESTVLGWFLALLALAGLTGRPLSGPHFEVDLRTRPEARPLAWAVIGTMIVATAVGYATGATYAGRYAAVFIPFLMLLVALGLSRLAPGFAAIALAGVLVLGLFGGYRNVTVERSDAQRTAAAIEARAEDGAVVVYCPDQLGPSTSRLLGDGFDQVTYPELAPPQLVDWVDYKERLDAASPQAFADAVLERAGDRQIFLVYSTDYITHEDTCPDVFNAFGAVRPPEVLTTTTEAWEPSSAVLFAPPTV